VVILLSRVSSRPDGRHGAAHLEQLRGELADAERLLAVVPEGRAAVTDQQVGFFQGGEVAAAVELGEAEIQQASLVLDRVLQSVRRLQPSQAAGGVAEVSGGR
jgi:hypothetical protein